MSPIILRSGVEVEKPLELALEFLEAYSSYDAYDTARRALAAAPERPYGRIILEKGNEHEAAYLARLVDRRKRVAQMLTYDDENFDDGQPRHDTEDAIRRAVGSFPHKNGRGTLRLIPMPE